VILRVFLVVVALLVATWLISRLLMAARRPRRR
jgi:hypothetical protein